MPAASIERGTENVVWSEDFSNGLAGNNPSGSWSVEGEHGSIWRVNANAPRGAYTTANERIQSATVTNGFAKFASDSANCTWNNGTPTAIPAAQFTSWDGSLVSPWIDLSTTPQVEIIFDQHSRWCCGDSPFELDIITLSGDTTTFLANEGLPINQGAPGTGTSSATTETRRFNISAAIANDPENVRIRFHHNGASRTSHYYWQIDDIRIAMLPDYERRVITAYTVFTDAGDEFGRIPRTQLPGVLNVGAAVMNYGSGDQTNLTVHSVLRPVGGQPLAEITTTVGTVSSGDTVVSDGFMNLPELGIGRYEVVFSVSSDEDDFEMNPADDTQIRHFEVTADQYSLDALGNHPTGEERRGQYGTASFRDNSSIYLMTLYPITSATTAVGGTIILGASSVAGNGSATIELSMYRMSDIVDLPADVSSPVDGMTSEVVNLTSAHVTAGRVTIPFMEPVNLQPGNYFLAALISGSGTADVSNDAEIYIADDNTVPQPNWSSAIYLPIDFDENSGTEGRHSYTNTNALAIRLNLAGPVGIAEHTTAQVSMYPNPTTGLLNIVSDATGLMNVEVIDVLGATVRTATFTGRTTLDMGGLAHGLYSVRVGNGTTTTVQRVTVQ